MNEKVNQLGVKLTNLAGSVQDKTKDTLSDVKNKTTQAVGLIKDKYSEASEQIAEKASVAVDFAKDKYEDSKEATKGFLAQGLQAMEYSVVDTYCRLSDWNILSYSKESGIKY